MLCYRSLSLYSTAMQNYWQIFVFGGSPKVKISVGDTRILVYLKTLKFALAQTRNIHFVLPPMQNPNVSQWNIGCVGLQRNIFALGMYISCCLCQLHLRCAANENCSFQQNMGFSPWSQKPPSSSPFMYSSCRHAHSRRRGRPRAV